MAQPLLREAVSVKRLLFLLTLTVATPLFAGGVSTILISVPEQKMVVFDHGSVVAQYPVSTSKFGLGDKPGSYATPVGAMRVSSKVGAGAPVGTVFKNLRPTGEVIKVNAPGRDPIITRVICLSGLEDRNRNASGRRIYIHGTPEERRIGKPVSFGCIRMRSKDVISLFNTINVGAEVHIIDRPVHLGSRQSGQS